LSLLSFYWVSRVHFISKISTFSLRLSSTLCLYCTIPRAYSLLLSNYSLAWTLSCSYFAIISKIYFSFVLSSFSSFVLLYNKSLASFLIYPISLYFCSFYWVSRVHFISKISTFSLRLSSTLCFYETIALAY